MTETYHSLHTTARSALRFLGERTAALEAKYLMMFVTGKSFEELIRDAQLYTSDDIQERVNTLLARRLGGEPLAYIIGEWDFMGLSLLITPDVLVPRVDTEILVDTALPSAVEGCRVLDLCCGSGCIGLAMATALPSARVVMIDNSEAALKVAKQNTRQHNLLSRVSCVNYDLMDGFSSNLGQFDLILCNPPYIPTEDYLALEASVLREPRSALEAGADGLLFYRQLAKTWKPALKPHGKLLLELGIGQANTVATIFAQADFDIVTIIQDTNNVERVLVVSPQ